MLREEIRKIAEKIGAELKEQKGVFCLKAVIAERKAFLSKRKLVYEAQIRIVEQPKEVHFFEMLVESSSGLSAGGGDDAPGFGFKTESYKVGFGRPREGVIEEQSKLFAKTYEYRFDYATVRETVRQAAEREGRSLVFKMTPV